MKHSITSSLLYSTAFALLLSVSDTSASGKGAPIKRTQPQVTVRLQPHPAGLKVDFFRPYPSEWDDLSVNKFFYRLQDEGRPTSQFVVDWCNGMVSVFECCPKEINEVTLARLITLLGQKAKQNKQIKVILQKYFSEKPELMKYWLARTIQSLKDEQFNQQALANIFYGHAQLGLKPNKALYEAWERAALSRLKQTDLKEQFSQKGLHSIYLTIKRFALEDLLRENFSQVPLIKVGKAKALKISTLQSDVSRSLQTYLKANNLSTLPQEEYWVEDIASYVDIFLALASQKVIIEVDGPNHFFPGTREYKPKNKLREEILNQTHIFTKLVRIPYYEWDELQTQESKSKYLEGKLSLSLEQTVQTDSSEIKEQETRPVKHGAKKSSLRADAPSFVPQANRLLPKKKLPLTSISEWKENEQK